MQNPWKHLFSVHLIYPPVLAATLYFIYIISSRFNEPENFSWIILLKEILFFYLYLITIIAFEKILLEQKVKKHPIIKKILVFTYSFIISLIISLAVYYFIKAAFIKIYDQNDSITIYHLTLRALTTCVGFIVIYSIYNSIGYYNSVLKEELQREQNKRENLEMQFQILYNRLDPHFLFNNLNTLHSLISEKDPEAENFVISLSRIMRYSFNAHQSQVVTLKDELDILSDFIRIMQSRFSNALNFEIVANTTLEKRILPMTLLHLVENIIKHNEINIHHPLQASIRIENEYMAIWNNIVPKLETRNSSTKSGLKNLKEVYKIRTQKEIKIETSDSHFKVTVPYL